MKPGGAVATGKLIRASSTTQDHFPGAHALTGAVTHGNGAADQSTVDAHAIARAQIFHGDLASSVTVIFACVREMERIVVVRCAAALGPATTKYPSGGRFRARGSGARVRRQWFSICAVQVSGERPRHHIEFSQSLPSVKAVVDVALDDGPLSEVLPIRRPSGSRSSRSAGCALSELRAVPGEGSASALTLLDGCTGRR